MRKLGTVVALCAALAAWGCGKKKEGGDKPAPDKQADKQETPPEPPPPPPPDPKLVERGAYVSGIAGCVGCHTPFGPQGPDQSKAFAGGLEIEEEFGKWRSPNITQDKKTGIGDWTDDQIIAAVREGKRPDGTLMFPIMPYMYYHGISNDDAKALVAFLRTLPAIENAVEGNTELQLPKVPMPPASGEAPPPDDPVKQGEYLAQIMHCHMCHTPMTEQGPDMAKSFAGGFPMKMPKELEAMMGSGTIYSPNITQDKKTGIGAWTDEQIAASFTKGVNKDGKPLAGPMQMYIMVGWSKLTEDDTKAVVAYLRSLPAVKNKVPKGDYKPPAGPPPGAPPPAP